jgi:hypothetical protein
MSALYAKRYPHLLAERQRALDVFKRDPAASGLVFVRCMRCDRSIATSSVDRARGEPPVLLDFPEHAAGWVCTECAP